MTKHEWMTATTEFRATVLNGLPDAEGVDPDEPFDALPYWLQRFVMHFVMAPRCVCHAGSVCDVACDRGRHHTGCPHEDTP